MIIDLDIVRTKIECCFAKSVYTMYQTKRYGINSCNISEVDLNKLNDLKFLMKYYTETSSCTINTIDTNCCDINKTVETINLL
jgi:hypothetical protein